MRLNFLPLLCGQVKTEQEALNLLYGGELMRTTAMHNLNKKSNRSHSILTVYMTQRARSGVSEKVQKNQGVRRKTYKNRALDTEKVHRNGGENGIPKYGATTVSGKNVQSDPKIYI